MVRVYVRSLAVLALGLILTNGCVKPASAPTKPEPIAQQVAARADVLLANDFETATGIPADWKAEGNVAIDAAEAFDGGRSLRLERDDRRLSQPVSVVSAPFKVSQRAYDVVVAAKSDLVSPDNSYNAVVSLELTDTEGKTGGGPIVLEFDGQRNWERVAKQVDIPASYTHARLRVQINKPTADSGSTASRSNAPRPAAAIPSSTASSSTPPNSAICSTRPTRAS